MSESTVDQLEHDRVLAERLATQRLTSSPMERAIDVVRLLTGVQCQDAPLARYSIALRTGLTDQAIRAELDAGAIVRTHVLRPTWHFVAPEDLRWLLALTSPKVESKMAARHRQLELTSTATERAHALLVSELAGRRWMTRPELAAHFAEAGLPSSGEQVGHLLMLAELRALICSGPMRGTTHTYGLVDDVAPSSPALDRPEMVRELTRRFFVGHGPASENDLRRWTTLTLTEIRSALTELAARALAVRGIRVNGIAPALMLRSSGQSEENFEIMHTNNPLGRGVEPEDVIAALRYLIEAMAVTGQVITIDSGQRFYGLHRDVQFLGDA